MKISGVYKITNIVTNDFYIGSSKDVKNRWYQHKYSLKWKEQPNSPLYKDMKKYDNRLCLYNGEILKHQALRARFYRAGVEHSAIEANKYLIK